MGKIDTSGWKEFRIGDYFKVEYGRFHAKDELGTGTVNYITTSGFNNGITNTCEEATHQGNCITVASDGAMGASFYQEEAFTTSNIVSTLTPLPHTPLNKYNALFLCAIIFGKRTEFGWLGFKMSVDRVRNLRVKLPSTHDGAPDWAYMESYMANLETKVAESLTMLQTAKDAEKKKVDTREWGEFRVGELFKTQMKGKKIQVPTGANVPMQDMIQDGSTPRITVTGVNNGVFGLYDYCGKNSTEYRIFRNFISVSFLGTVFYQEGEATLDMKVHCLQPNHITLNKYTGNFLVSAIKASLRESSYSDQISSTILPEMTIMLPKDKTGQPDWAYMEEYMRKVEKKTENSFNKFIK